MENSKPAPSDPQAAAPSPGTKNQKPISGHKRRDEFICGILVCDGLTPLELKTAVRLAMFFNCTTGQCNPGYPALGKALNVDPRSARRCVRALEGYGILREHRSAGGHHKDKNKFDLFMPPARATRLTSPVRMTAPTSPVNPEKPAEARVTKLALTGDERQQGRVTPRGPHNTDKNTGSTNTVERASGPRTARVDRVPVTESRETSFSKLNNCYPKDHRGDETKAFAAFELALDAGHRLSEMIEEAIYINIAAGKGTEVPNLEQFLLSKFGKETSPASALEELH